jgi:putative effector of murein hydrolase LrgA (UPF0299 family)
MMGDFAPPSYLAAGPRRSHICASFAELFQSRPHPAWSSFAIPMLYAVATLFAFQLLGEFIARFSGLPLPGALVGTLLLLLALLLYKRLPKALEDTSGVLLQNMMLLFIPVIAGVMQEFDHLRHEWLPFVLACVLGSAITFAATAWTFRFFLQYQHAQEARRSANSDATGEETA